MITVQNLVPEIYYNDSRDFQLIGRVFETAFSSVKTAIDLLLNNPYNKNMDDKLVDLLSKTLGFDTKHKYTVSDLKVICSCFKEIMRKKGTKEAIEILIRALLKSQNINKDYLVEIFTEDNFESGQRPDYFEEFTAFLIVPYELKDKILIEDILDYILPSGFNFRIINAVVTNLSSDQTVIKTSSDVSLEDIKLIEDYVTESGQPLIILGAAEIGSDMNVAVIKDKE